MLGIRQESFANHLNKKAAMRRENLASHFVLSWLLTGSRAPRLPCCFCLQSVQDLNQVNLLTSFVLVFCCFCFTCPHTWSLEKKGSEVERNRKFRYLFPNVGSKSKKTWKKKQVPVQKPSKSTFSSWQPSRLTCISDINSCQWHTV